MQISTQNILPVAGLSRVTVCAHTGSHRPQAAVCPGAFSIAGWVAPGAPGVTAVPSSPFAPPPNPSLKIARPRNPAGVTNATSASCLRAGGWQDAEGTGTRARVMALATSCPLGHCPGARATQPLQRNGRCFGWSCGWGRDRINMPTSTLKPLKCRHMFASNCSGESGPLGALTF